MITKSVILQIKNICFQVQTEDDRQDFWKTLSVHLKKIKVINISQAELPSEQIFTDSPSFPF